MSVLETIAIEDPDKPGDYLVINRKDFDPKTQKAWDPSKAKADGKDSDPAGKKGKKGEKD